MERDYSDIAPPDKAGTRSGSPDFILSPLTTNGSGKSDLPLLCQELFYRYCIEANEELFESFYRSTYPVFLGFATEKCSVNGHALDPREIVNRLYGVLVIHASSRRRSVPIRSLLSWCFGAISNLIKEEVRFRSRELPELNRINPPIWKESPLDSVIQDEDLQRRKRLYQDVLKLIHMRNNLLSDREREILHRYYCRNQSLRDVAARMKIRSEHAGVVLFRARRRIAQFLRG